MVTNFVSYLFIWLLSTLFVWFIGHDDFHLTFGKSSDIVLIFYVCYLMSQTLSEVYSDSRKEIEAEKAYLTIIEALKNMEHQNSSEAKLEAYRKSFGQNQGDLN